MEKINKGITQYAEILGPEIANELRDVRDFYDPQTRAFSQQFNSDIQGKIDELSQKKEGLSEAETKAKTEEEKMSAAKEQAKRVGTTPQEILDGIMGIETPEQLKQFSEDTGKAPEEMGMMVVQEVARRLNTAFTENMEKTDFEGMGQIAKELTGVIKKMDPETAKQMFGDKVRADIKEVDTAVDRIRILNKEGGGKSVMVRAAKALFGVYASFFWHMHFIGMQQFAEALTGKNTRFMDLGKGEVQEKIGRLSKKNIKQPKPKKKKYRSIVKIAGVVSAGAKEAQNED